MTGRRLTGLLLALFGLGIACSPPAHCDEDSVVVNAPGVSYGSATHECKAGHKIEKRSVTLDSGAVRYALGYSGCVDPSHGIQRPSSEGNFGMPQPISGNWYWGGFLKFMINGVDATNCPVEDWRVLESGARGLFQVVFAHPDATVMLRFLLLPGANHLLCEVGWTPLEGKDVKSAQASLRCYPSFFTSARKRVGDRHCMTPRTDEGQDKTLVIDPEADTWLYYYDTIFDVAKGEGDGPCAALLNPDGLTSGSVSIGGYAVLTTLNYDPSKGRALMGFYDFAGHTNAEAEEYLRTQGAADAARLAEADFRPLGVQNLDVDQLRAEAMQLLADAGPDGVALTKQVDELLAGVDGYHTRAAAGDWKAEAELAALVANSSDLFWRLRAFAVLNNPDR